MNTGDFTHNLHSMTFFQNLRRNTRSYIMTYTDHDRWLYIYYRSLPATLYMVDTIMYMSTEYAKTTRSCSMTLTGHDPQLYNQYGHCRRHYTSFTLLCETPPNTLILHGRILRPIPVTTQGFIFVSHYYWGAGRPE